MLRNKKKKIEKLKNLLSLCTLIKKIWTKSAEMTETGIGDKWDDIFL